MKKIFFPIIITLCTLLSNPCSAQFNVYHSFPHINASWCEDSYWWEEQGCSASRFGYTIYNYFDHYANGDTIVNGKTYIKIRTSGGYQNSLPCFPIIWSNYDKLACLLRDDTVAKKVYISLPPHFSVDTLLYDYSLDSGDYLPQTYVSSPRDSIYVYSIDSVLVGSSYRKEFNIAQYKSVPFVFTSIIEGIGSMVGLLYLTPPFENGSNMNGFVNGTIIFPFGDSCSRFVLSVTNISKPTPNITIYPNPSNGKFTFSYSNPELVSGFQTIAVFNVLGENVYHATLNQVQDDYEINLSAQPNGVYFYRIIAEDESLVGEGKLVIQK